MESFRTAGALAVVFFLCLSLLVTNVSLAQAQTREKVVLKNIQISGNVRVEDDGIRLHVKSRAGEVFDPAERLFEDCQRNIALAAALIGQFNQESLERDQLRRNLSAIETPPMDTSTPRSQGS